MARRCEPNYAVSRHVAEMANTLSSLPLILVGAVGVYYALRERYGLRFLLPSALTVLVGIGSVAFHSTLTRTGQALDELSMVAAATAHMYTLLERGARPTMPWLPSALVAYNAAFLVAYALVPKLYSLFVGSFVALCVAGFAISAPLYRGITDVRLKHMFWASASMFGGAFFLCWIPDNVACEHVGFLYLHAAFHVLAAFSVYIFGVFVTQRFFEERHAEFRRRAAASPLPGDVDDAGQFDTETANRGGALITLALHPSVAKLASSVIGVQPSLAIMGWLQLASAPQRPGDSPVRAAAVPDTVDAACGLGRGSCDRGATGTPRRRLASEGAAVHGGGACPSTTMHVVVGGEPGSATAAASRAAWTTPRGGVNSLALPAFRSSGCDEEVGVPDFKYRGSAVDSAMRDRSALWCPPTVDYAAVDTAPELITGCSRNHLFAWLFPFVKLQRAPTAGQA